MAALFALWVMRQTITLMGGRALGVPAARAILFVAIAERARLSHRAALEGGRARLRPMLMTSCAMVAGMVPMVGGLVASTLETLFVLPAVFAVVQRRAGVSVSMAPDNTESRYPDEGKVQLLPNLRM